MTDETAQCFYMLTAAAAEPQRRRQWRWGRGTETDKKEKQHLLGNNYLSHPTKASSGGLEPWCLPVCCTAVSKPKALFSPLRVVDKASDYLQHDFSNSVVPCITWEISLAVQHWQYGLVSCDRNWRDCTKALITTLQFNKSLIWSKGGRTSEETHQL